MRMDIIAIFVNICTLIWELWKKMFLNTVYSYIFIVSEITNTRVE